MNIVDAPAARIAEGREGRGERAGGALAPAARRERALGWLLTVLIVLAALGLWQAAVWIFHLETALLPSPGDVAAAFADPATQATILTNLGPTIEEALAGFVLCVVIGVALAVAMDSSRAVRNGLYPLLIASQAVPTIAIAALLIALLGYGLAPRVVVVVLYSFFAVTVNVHDGLRTLDPELPGLLRTLGASRWDILRTARLPAALPGFFTGAKLAITYSAAAAIYSEWVGSTAGLGFALMQARNQYQQPQAFALVVTMAALGLGGFVLVAILEWLLVPWTRVSRES